MIDFQSSAIAQSASGLPCDLPLPAGEGKGELFKLCAAYAHPPFLPKPWRRQVVKKGIITKRIHLLFAVWLFKAFQRDSKRFKPIQRFWKKILSQYPGLFGYMAVHGFGSHASHRMHFRSNPSLLPPFPSVQNSYQEPQIRKPLQSCAKLCKSVQGPPGGGAGLPNPPQPNLRDFKTL
jgi:hypothetical protein